MLTPDQQKGNHIMHVKEESQPIGISLKTIVSQYLSVYPELESQQRQENATASRH